MPSYISGSNAAVKNSCIRNNVNMMSVIHSSELLDRKMSYIYVKSTLLFAYLPTCFSCVDENHIHQSYCDNSL